MSGTLATIEAAEVLERKALGLLADARPGSRLHLQIRAALSDLRTAKASVLARSDVLRKSASPMDQPAAVEMLKDFFRNPAKIEDGRTLPIYLAMKAAAGRPSTAPRPFIGWLGA